MKEIVSNAIDKGISAEDIIKADNSQFREGSKSENERNNR